MSVLAKALVAAQKEMPAVKPDGHHPRFRSEFVTLGHLLAKARPVLNKHGIAVAQFPTIDHNTGFATLTTILIHESGEKLEYTAPLYLPKQDPQGHGSALTYARRYALAAALGISDEEDDDGEAASTASTAEPEPAPEKPKPKKSPARKGSKLPEDVQPTPAQWTRLRELLDELHTLDPTVDWPQRSRDLAGVPGELLTKGSAGSLIRQLKEIVDTYDWPELPGELPADY